MVKCKGVGCRKLVPLEGRGPTRGVVLGSRSSVSIVLMVLAPGGGAVPPGVGPWALQSPTDPTGWPTSAPDRAVGGGRQDPDRVVQPRRLPCRPQSGSVPRPLAQPLQRPSLRSYRLGGGRSAPSTTIDAAECTRAKDFFRKSVWGPFQMGLFANRRGDPILR